MNMAISALPLICRYVRREWKTGRFEIDGQYPFVAEDRRGLGHSNLESVTPL